MLVFASSAFAADDVIKKRKQILKGFGDATKPVASMVKDRQPFELELVRATLKTYVTGSKELQGLFPDTSKTGEETKARAEIWEDKAKFNSLYDKLSVDATAALTSITDAGSFKSVIPKVLADCKTCHDKYRQKD